jgi:hypothetical protein
MMPCKVVIPSRQRSRLIARKALRLFPNATVCVGESEAKEYARTCPGVEIVTHPDSVVGIGPMRQWVLDHFQDERLCFVDDDVHALYALVGLHKRDVTDPADIQRAVDMTAQCAADAKTGVFGFNQAWDVRKFRPHVPFMLNAWVGGVIGVVGREIRYDTSLLMRADIDFCLQALMRFRVVWQDARLSFVHDRSGVTGGNAVVRSKRREDRELKYLKEKWGRYLEYRQVQTTLRLMIHVQRVWPLSHAV